MERETVTRNYCNIHFFRKIQILLMILCVVFYVMCAFYFCIFYPIESYVPLKNKCVEDYHGFVEELFGAPYEEASKNHNLSSGCPCVSSTCVTKCCPSGHSFISSYINNTMVCAPNASNGSFAQALEGWPVKESGWRYKYRKSGKSWKRFFENKTATNVTIHNFGENPICKSGLYKIPVAPVFLIKNGTVFLHNMKADILLDLNEYCFESAELGNTMRTFIFTFNNCEIRWSVVANLINHLNETYNVLHIESHVLLLFISVTMSVYLYIPELRNKNGSTLTCYIVTLWANSLYRVIESYGYSQSLLGQIGNVLSASRYSWLTAIGFEIWLKLSRPLRPCGGISLNKYKLAAYCFFTFSISTLGIFDMRNSSEIKSMRQKQLQYWNDIFRLKSFKSYCTFVFVPIFLQITLSVMMFIFTLVNLSLHLSLLGADFRKQSRDTVKNFSVYFKLSIVTGLPLFFVELLALKLRTQLSAQSLIFIFDRLYIICLLVFSVLMLRDEQVYKLFGLIYLQLTRAQETATANVRMVTWSRGTRKEPRRSLESVPTTSDASS